MHTEISLRSGKVAMSDWKQTRLIVWLSAGQTEGRPWIHKLSELENIQLVSSPGFSKRNAKFSQEKADKIWFFKDAIEKPKKAQNLALVKKKNLQQDWQKEGKST